MHKVTKIHREVSHIPLQVTQRYAEVTQRFTKKFIGNRRDL